MVMPASLIPALRTSSAAFAAEPATTQIALANMVWRAVEPRRQHRKYPGSASFSKAEMRSIWGNETAMYAGLAGKHFLVMQSSNLDGYTLAYQPVEELVAGLQACLADPAATALMDDDGTPLRRFAAAIDPRRAHVQTRADEWRGVKPANAVPISVESLESYVPHATPMERQVIAALIRVARNTVQPGAIPHRYVSGSTGRLFAGKGSLQFASRNIRAAALAGCWDYDIANCHFAILTGLAQQMRLTTPAIDAYLANKHAVREAIAQDVGITAAQAKECLLMVVYGAHVSTSARTAIGRKIGRDAATRLAVNETFVAIRDEVKTISGRIILWHTRRAGQVVNQMGLMVSARQPKRVLLSHITQGYEAVALRAVIRRHGDRILLCMHDGWVTADRIDVAQCEDDIYADTGLRLRIEEARLEHPVAAGHERTHFDDDEIKISLEDQQVADASDFSYDSSSPLRACSSTTLDRRKSEPGDGIRLSLRAEWNYRPD